MLNNLGSKISYLSTFFKFRCLKLSHCKCQQINIQLETYLSLTIFHSTIFKCEFLLLSAEHWMVKASFGITVFLNIQQGQLYVLHIKNKL